MLVANTPLHSVNGNESIFANRQDILIGKDREVVSAKDGFQAIEMASGGNIDLIFMDIRMPGMDGVETFLKIKQILPECIV